MKKRIIILVVLAWFLVACAWLMPSKPAEGPGTDYPCGVQGISCGNGFCCWSHEACIPGTELCRNLGNELRVGARDAGVRQATKEKP